ncbi:MAG: hypothetical protein KKB51_11675 [Candidatus Riflebacteria bacterium]|nr:hypothetical protein [Candidatus Riflebacteria bacterium]
MRDKRFVAVHRGGTLSIEQHRQLISWAHDCAQHVLPLFEEHGIAERLIGALETAKAWERGEVSVGSARKASSEAIAVANKPSTPTAIAVARAVGHAVATAHMADHSLIAAEYALKAIYASGKSVENERNWQDEHLPSGIRELVISARYRKSHVD